MSRHRNKVDKKVDWDYPTGWWIDRTVPSVAESAEAENDYEYNFPEPDSCNDKLPLRCNHVSNRSNILLDEPLPPKPEERDSAVESNNQQTNKVGASIMNRGTKSPNFNYGQTMGVSPSEPAANEPITHSGPELSFDPLPPLWPFISPKLARKLVEYRIVWELPNYIKQYHGDGASPKLREVLTITGEWCGAQAMSCNDYVVQNYPLVGPLIINGLEEALSGIDFGEEQSDHPVTRALAASSPHSNRCQESMVEDAESKIRLKFNVTSSIDLRRSSLRVIAEASHEAHQEIKLCLAWLSAALRYCPSIEVMGSEVKITSSQDEQRIISIEVQSLSPAPQSNDACWRALLPHTVMAIGFSTRQAPVVGLRGLELPFEYIASLSQVRSFVEYDGGFVLEGLRSLLIPMRWESTTEAIQWHFYDKKALYSREGETVQQLLRSFKFRYWYKSLDTNRLTSARSFLGWTEDAIVMIGTQSHSVFEIWDSGIPRGKLERHLYHKNFTLGTSGLGFATAEANVSRVPIRMPSYITCAHEKSISDALADDSDKSVLIYDSGSKIGWLIPLPDVLLFLVHAISKQRHYEFFDGDKNVILSLADINSHTTASSMQLLYQSLNLKVQNGNSPTGVREPFSEKIQQILLLLQLIADRLQSAEIEYQNVGAGAPKFLHGVEFRDVLQMENSIDIKEVQIDQPWAYLASERTAVLFCQGIGQLIVSQQTELLCNDWKVIPEGHNYMATTGSTLRSLLRQNRQGIRGSRIGRNIEWVEKQALTAIHIPLHSSRFHEQELRAVPSAPLDESICRFIEGHLSYGFVFTKVGRRNRCVDPNQETSGDIDSASLTNTSGNEELNTSLLETTFSLATVLDVKEEPLPSLLCRQSSDPKLQENMQPSRNTGKDPILMPGLRPVPNFLSAAKVASIRSSIKSAINSAKESVSRSPKAHGKTHETNPSIENIDLLNTSKARGPSNEFCQSLDPD